MSWSRRANVQAGGLLLVGAVAGGVLAATVGASASSSTSTSTSTGPAAYAAGPGGGPAYGRAPAFGGRPGHRGLPLSGTVKSVGSSSVTITVNGATKTYAVDANSDIDKNGEAKLSDLKAGDAVRFGVTPDGKTIVVLHAGDEAKDRPAGGPDGHGPGRPGYGSPGYGATPPTSAPSPS